MANEPRERLDKLRKAKVSGEPRKGRKAPPKEEETENPLPDDYTNDVGRKAPPKEEETENPLPDDYTNDVSASPNE